MKFNTKALKVNIYIYIHRETSSLVSFALLVMNV